MEFVCYLFGRKKICTEILRKEPERNLEEEEIVKGNENCLSATISKVHGVPVIEKGNEEVKLTSDVHN